MSRLLMVIGLALSLLLPAAARAESPIATPRAQSGLPIEKMVMIAVGVAIGAVLVHVAAPGEFGAIAGGLLGGIAANWWYRHGGEERVHAWLRMPLSAPAMPAQPPLLHNAALR
jgi:hypothetical protein